MKAGKSLERRSTIVCIPRAFVGWFGVDAGEPKVLRTTHNPNQPVNHVEFKRVLSWNVFALFSLALGQAFRCSASTQRWHNAKICAAASQTRRHSGSPMLLDLFSRQLSEELQGISSWILIPTSGNNQKEGVHTGTSQKKSIPSRLGAMIRAYYFHEKATDVIKDAPNHCLTAYHKTNCGGTHYPPSTSTCIIFEFCITIPSPSVFTFEFLRRNWKKTSAPWAWSTDEPLLPWLLVRRVALAIWLLLTETSCPSSLPAGIPGRSSARRVPDWDFWHTRSMVALVSMKTLFSCMSKSTVRATMSKLLVQRFQVRFDMICCDVTSMEFVWLSGFGVHTQDVDDKGASRKGQWSQLSFQTSGGGHQMYI